MRSFEPTLEAAHARLAAVNPDAYARTRNALRGAVTRLSPYLTHGVLSLREVYDTVNARHPMNAQHKLVFELGWRAYWRHVWEHLGEGVHQSIHTGLLPDDAYQPEMPTDVLEARTGIPVIDLAVRELYATGYLHNHARMWLASYLVHLRKVHWHGGAQWMLGHLLDGDVASNHLSWQWVAGTGSSKPYLFNAENVAKYAPADWHSPGTVIDTSYERMDAMARSPKTYAPMPNRPSLRALLPEVEVVPPLMPAPTCSDWTAPDVALVNDRDVWLLHPWAVRCPDSALQAGVVKVAVGLTEAHANQPWSALRWDFVTRALQSQTPRMWWTDVQTLSRVLSTARSVRWQPDPHMDPFMNLLHSDVARPVPSPALFTPVDRHCASFSKWWSRTQVSTGQ